MSSSIFLIGTARSGSTWSLRVLAQAPGVTKVDEPDYIDVNETRGVGSRGFGPYPVLDPGQASSSYEALWDVAFAGSFPSGFQFRLGQLLFEMPRVLREPMVRGAARFLSRRPKRTVVKSIFAPFAVEWIYQRYKPQVVVIQRDPLNVVASWLELQIPHFAMWDRRDIQQRYLEPLGIASPTPGAAEHERAAWCIGLLTTVLADRLQDHPEWVLVTHEELCINPVAQFESLFRRLDLAWTDATANYVMQSDQPGEGLQVTNRVAHAQPLRWRERLTERQVSEIGEVLETFPSRGWVRELAVESPGAGKNG